MASVLRRGLARAIAQCSPPPCAMLRSCNALPSSLPPSVLPVVAARPAPSLARFQGRGFAAAAAEEPERNPLTQVPGAAVPSGDSTADSAAPQLVYKSKLGSGKARAFARNIAISPSKLKLACDLLRYQPIEHALIQCDMSSKKSCKVAKKVLHAAKYNAVNNHGLDEDRLIVGVIKADKGQHLKRIEIKGRGRMGLRHKYRAHLTVVLHEVDDIFKGLPPERRLTLGKDRGPKVHKQSAVPGFRPGREPTQAGK